MVTFEEIKNNTDIQTYIIKADESLCAIGYTEHSFAHVMKVSSTAGEILRKLGYSERDVENILKGQGIDSVKNVFFLGIDDNGNVFAIKK